MWRIYICIYGRSLHVADIWHTAVESCYLLHVFGLHCRLDWTVLSLCIIWAKCRKIEGRHSLDWAVHLSCHFYWRWHFSCNSNCSFSFHLSSWPRDCMSNCWGFIFYMVDVWHSHWSSAAILTEEISLEGTYLENTFSSGQMVELNMEWSISDIPILIIRFASDL